MTAADAVVQALAESDPELPGFTGPVAVVGALVAASGRVVVEETRLRLFILGELIPPTGVRGSPRLLAEADLDLVGSWIEEFVRHTRMGFGGRTGAEVAAQWLQIGAGAVVWVVDGEPVSLARFGPPAAGVSRVGPVFTPEDRRGHGYGRGRNRRRLAVGVGRRSRRCRAVHRSGQPGVQPALPQARLRTGR